MPDPVAAEAKVIHGAVLSAVQAHPAGAMTVTVPVPASLPNSAVSGVMS